MDLNCSSKRISKHYCLTWKVLINGIDSVLFMSLHNNSWLCVYCVIAHRGALCVRPNAFVGKSLIWKVFVLKMCHKFVKVIRYIELHRAVSLLRFCFRGFKEFCRGLAWWKTGKSSMVITGSCVTQALVYRISIAMVECHDLGKDHESVQIENNTVFDTRLSASMNVNRYPTVFLYSPLWHW